MGCVTCCHQGEELLSIYLLAQETELVTAGFPCIDVSRAGLKRGMAGQSTSLVRHVFRLLEQAIRDNRGVPWVLLENVRYSACCLLRSEVNSHVSECQKWS